MHNTTLFDLIENVIRSLEQLDYSPRTIQNYKYHYSSLRRLAAEMGETEATEALFSEYLGRCNGRSEKAAVLERRQRIRCVNLLRSCSRHGTADISRRKGLSVSDRVSSEPFRAALDGFVSSLEEERLRPNTIRGYKRIVSYFLLFLETKGYPSFSEVMDGDVRAFISRLYNDGHYKPATITGPLSGLRRFLSGKPELKKLITELPSHFSRETKIMEVYERNELASIRKLMDGGALSRRDTALCALLLETGLRGVDVCGLKLGDIDWDKDILSIRQRKTGRPLILPLKSSYGNALADYILNERPPGHSEYVFLRSFAPFGKLESGSSSLHRILRMVERMAGVRREGRPSGSRMTRRNAASSMLRAGIPMSEISAFLGHRDPNIVNAYLSTDETTMAACTLPLPHAGKDGGYAR